MRFVRSIILILLLIAFAASASGVYAHLDHMRELRGSQTQSMPDQEVSHRDMPKKNGDRQKRSPEERAQEKLDWMKKELKLTEQQVIKIKAILIEKQSNRIDKQSLKQASPEAKKAAVEKMLQQRRVMHGKIVAVLTSTQRAKYESCLKTEGGDYRKLYNTPRKN